MEIKPQVTLKSLVEFKSINEQAQPVVSADKIAKIIKINHRSINKAISHNREYLGNIITEIGDHNRRIYYLNFIQCITLAQCLRTNNYNKSVRIGLNRLIIIQFNMAYQKKWERQHMQHISKPYTISLDEAIKNDKNLAGKYIYNNINRLIYKSTLGVSTHQLRIMRNITKNESITNYLTVNELKKINIAKRAVIMLAIYQADYNTIKLVLSNQPYLLGVSKNEPQKTLS